VPLVIGSQAIEFQGNASPDALPRQIERQLGPLTPRALAIYHPADGGTPQADPLYGTVSDQ
jgi:hypothetical protein